MSGDSWHLCIPGAGQGSGQPPVSLSLVLLWCAGWTLRAPPAWLTSWWKQQALQKVVLLCLCRQVFVSITEVGGDLVRGAAWRIRAHVLVAQRKAGTRDFVLFEEPGVAVAVVCVI